MFLFLTSVCDDELYSKKILIRFFLFLFLRITITIFVTVLYLFVGSLFQ